MKIEKVLKQVTQKRIDQEIKRTQKVEMSPDLNKWVKEYEKVGERSHFTWPWIYLVAQTIVFPMTIENYRKQLWTTKTLVFMFNVLLDDVADRSHNKQFLDNLIDITSGKIKLTVKKISEKEKNYFRFAVKLWKYIEETIVKYPRYTEFKDLFEYDTRQYLNAMNYACLINKKPYLINKIESWLYISHGMQVFPIMDIDLMCSKFDKKELGLMREVAWNFQRMARIGNWVSTWEREIEDNDFTSGIWACALDKGIIDVKELNKRNKKDLVNKIRKARIESSFLKEWQDAYNEIIKLSKKTKDKALQKGLKKFLLGIEELMILHLSSRYYK